MVQRVLNMVQRVLNMVQRSLNMVQRVLIMVQRVLIIVQRSLIIDRGGSIVVRAKRRTIGGWGRRDSPRARGHASAAPVLYSPGRSGPWPQPRP